MKLETVARKTPLMLPRARAPTPRRFARQSQTDATTTRRCGQRPKYERNLEGDDWLRIDASAINVRGHAAKVHALASAAKLSMGQKIQAR
jgi:hypothetical protein